MGIAGAEIPFGAGTVAQSKQHFDGFILKTNEKGMERDIVSRLAVDTRPVVFGCGGRLGPVFVLGEVCGLLENSF